MINEAVLDSRMKRFELFCNIHGKAGIAAFIGVFAIEATDEQFNSVMAKASLCALSPAFQKAGKAMP